MSAAFDGLVGHDGVIGRLRMALQDGHLPHGLLFFGPPGVGKARVATDLAQTLFCQSPLLAGPPPRGCGQCPGCRRVHSGNHPDLLRVTLEPEKTRIAVEQIRDLSRFFALTALEGDWKVGILDDASQMSDSAANALLKTLEEPPGKSLIILITARPGSLLPTIRSRCQAVRFSPLPSHLLVELAVAKAGISPEEAQDVALLAEGSVARLLALCAGELPAWRQRFREFMQTMPTLDLAQLVAAAAEWSDKERFAVTASLLRGWFAQAIHGNLNQDSPTAVLEVAAWGQDLLQRAQVFNLNRQLVLEALFIRCQRLLRPGSTKPAGSTVDRIT